jgi:hypothetical protein
MKSRLRQTPTIRTTQRLSTKFLKYGTAGVGLIAVCVTLFTIYGNLGVSHDTVAGGGPANQYAGSALKFNGTSDVVSVGKVKGQIPDKFTVMAWVKWDIDPSKGNSWANIFSINSNSSSDEGVFWIQHNQDNSKFEFAVETSKSRTFIQSLTKPLKGAWYHVAGVYDGSNISIYINGVLEAKTALTGTVVKPSTDDRITIGAWASSSDNYRRFTGVIDEVAAWDSPLAASDIRKYLTTKVAAKEKGIIMSYNFDEASGTEINDINSGYKGTITGAKYVTSGAPVSPEFEYQVANGKKKYTHTFTNGYTVELTNMSQDPGGVLFYFLQSSPALTSSYSKYNFNYGVVGFFIANSSSITYTAKYTYSASNNSLAASSTDFLVATQPANDASAWTKETIVAPASKSAFSLVPASQRVETAVGESVAMPIVLSYFRGSSTAPGTAFLEWATASEKNNEFFTIERSIDGTTFDIIKELPGAGNSTKKLFYDYTDTTPKNGINYYRLKQTDYDGKFEYSKVFAVTIEGGKSESTYDVQEVYPNPFIDHMTIKIATDSENPVDIKLLNMRGATVKTETFNPVTGENTFELTNMLGLEKGIYILSISQSGEQPKTIRVAKK